MNLPATDLTPVRKQLTVPGTPEEAFAVFTEGIGRWWPASHTLLTAPLASVVIEPFVGGRWYHRGDDGSEADNGSVLAWEPPRRLVLSWNLDGRWQYVRESRSEVEVRFAARTPGLVDVTLEHRGFAGFGDTAADLREGVDSENGWGLMLRLFHTACRDRVGALSSGE